MQVIRMWKTSLRPFALLKEIPFSSLQHVRPQSGVPCPVLRSPVQERHGSTGVSLFENHQDGQGLEQRTYEKRLRKLCLFSLKQAEGRFDCCVQLPNRHRKDEDNLCIS